MNTDPSVELSVTGFSRRRWMALTIGMLGIVTVLYLDDLAGHVHGLPSLSQDMSYGPIIRVRR